MRTLCLNLQNFDSQAGPGEPLRVARQALKAEIAHGALPLYSSSCAEIFVAISPRVQFRDPHFIFIDIESTAGLLGGEDQTLEKTLSLAQSLVAGPDSKLQPDDSALPLPEKILQLATAGIADRPSLAQVLATRAPQAISPPGEDARTLGEMPLAVLVDLEGLKPWTRARQVEHIITFFQSLGMKTVREIYGFPLSTFRERWGELGVTLWKRLHGQDEQVISPLIPNDPFTTYRFLDYPVTLSDQLMAYLRPSLQFLFMRLHGLGRFAQKLELTLYCEYSDQRHAILIEPVSPSRDQRLYEDLLYQKLDKLDLLNPIREFEVQMYDVGEKIMQLDFFEPRDYQVTSSGHSTDSQDRWQRLISLAKQADVEMGFLEPLPKHFPEESFHLKADWPELLAPKDHVEHVDNAIQIKSIYAKNLMTAPRPTLLLKHPQKLSRGKLRQYRKMTFFPTERIQSSWWLKLKKIAGSKADLGCYRDYYFALSTAGELVWIYQDRETKEYYLHGYFD